MVKHCTKCRRRWIVSVWDKRSQYICPDCRGELKEVSMTEKVKVPEAVASCKRERKDGKKIIDVGLEEADE